MHTKGMSDEEISVLTGVPLSAILGLIKKGPID